MGKRARSDLRKAFGRDENGFIDIPLTISNVTVARLIHGNEMGCSRCFPHGQETHNSSDKKARRSWKRFRRTQHKPKDV
ncbi:MAG: phosphate ABC transporter substrate-binding protein [Phycisphaerae bacterium]|nr:phosphate ABC transporter substrate-binding protein [Phycisphaerae bacterium]